LKFTVLLLALAGLVVHGATVSEFTCTSVEPAVTITNDTGCRLEIPGPFGTSLAYSEPLFASPFQVGILGSLAPSGLEMSSYGRVVSTDNLFFPGVGKANLRIRYHTQWHLVGWYITRVAGWILIDGVPIPEIYFASSPLWESYDLEIDLGRNYTVETGTEFGLSTEAGFGGYSDSGGGIRLEWESWELLPRNGPIAETPEPTTFASLVLGLAVFLAWARPKARSQYTTRHQ
jgi:hypothetical protein